MSERELAGARLGAGWATESVLSLAAVVRQPGAASAQAGSKVESVRDDQVCGQ